MSSRRHVVVQAIKCDIRAVFFAERVATTATDTRKGSSRRQRKADTIYQQQHIQQQRMFHACHYQRGAGFARASQIGTSLFFILFDHFRCFYFRSRHRHRCRRGRCCWPQQTRRQCLSMALPCTIVGWIDVIVIGDRNVRVSWAFHRHACIN